MDEELYNRLYSLDERDFMASLGRKRRPQTAEWDEPSSRVLYYEVE
jgi:hypothetical protein